MEDATTESANVTRWWAMAAYGVLYTLAGVGLALSDVRDPSGADMNDIFDVVGILMSLSGLLVVGTGVHAAKEGKSLILLALVFFLHVGPTLTFGIWTLIFMFGRY